MVQPVLNYPTPSPPNPIPKIKIRENFWVFGGADLGVFSKILPRGTKIFDLPPPLRY